MTSQHTIERPKDARNPTEIPAETSADISKAPPPPRMDVEMDANQMYREAFEAWKSTHGLRRAYTRSGDGWASVDSWSRLVVAFTATLGTVTIFANNENWAAVFAVVTALVAGLNAAFNPPERARLHRELAKSYAAQTRPLEELVSILESRRTMTGIPAGAFSDEQLRGLWARYLDIQSLLDRIDQRAPSSKRTGDYSLEFFVQFPPSTRAELRRLKRAIEVNVEGQQYLAEAREMLMKQYEPYDLDRTVGSGG